MRNKNSRTSKSKEIKANVLDENTIVINIYNNKEYKVTSDNGNTVEVFDPANGSIEMARADVIPLDKIKSAKMRMKTR